MVAPSLRKRSSSETVPTNPHFFPASRLNHYPISAKCIFISDCGRCKEARERPWNQSAPRPVPSLISNSLYEPHIPRITWMGSLRGGNTVSAAAAPFPQT